MSGHGCPKCATSGPSKAESSLFDFVQSLAPDAIQSDRTVLNGRELDIYVPSKGLAIEYCGLHWHSELFRTKDYHFRKWQDCQSAGIRLLTVFEDEDTGKVQNAIRTALGRSQKGKSARQLDLSPVDSKTATAFFDRHHLQGSCGKKVTLGLWDGNALVSAMAFGAPSRQSKHDWELRRFCTDGKTHAGAASRLLKAFLVEYQPDSVVSLSDRRWFEGGMYRTLGFEWDGAVPPDYAYTKNGQRWHKSGFRKSGIKRRLPEFYDEDLTEREMMENAGFSRIWDCGKDRWVYTTQ